MHAVNNLLQISEHCEDENDAASYRYTCGSATLCRTFQQNQPATKREFDSIADELLLMESRLLTGTGDEENDSTSNPTEQPSLRERLTSTHRTVITGNYSYETLELCLKKRDVQLDWFKCLPLPSESLDGEAAGTDNGNADEREASIWDMDGDRIVCGFIVNVPEADEEANYGNLWGAKKLFSCAPLVGRFFD